MCRRDISSEDVIKCSAQLMAQVIRSSPASNSTADSMCASLHCAPHHKPSSFMVPRHLLTSISQAAFLRNLGQSPVRAKLSNTCCIGKAQSGVRTINTHGTSAYTHALQVSVNDTVFLDHRCGWPYTCPLACQEKALKPATRMQSGQSSVQLQSGRIRGGRAALSSGVQDAERCSRDRNGALWVVRSHRAAGQQRCDAPPAPLLSLCCVCLDGPHLPEVRRGAPLPNPCRL